MSGEDYISAGGGGGGGGGRGGSLTAGGPPRNSTGFPPRGGPLQAGEMGLASASAAQSRIGSGGEPAPRAQPAPEFNMMTNDFPALPGSRETGPAGGQEPRGFLEVVKGTAKLRLEDHELGGEAAYSGSSGGGGGGSGGGKEEDTPEPPSAGGDKRSAATPDYQDEISSHNKPHAGHRHGERSKSSSLSEPNGGHSGQEQQQHHHHHEPEPLLMVNGDIRPGGKTPVVSINSLPADREGAVSPRSFTMDANQKLTYAQMMKRERQAKAEAEIEELGKLEEGRREINSGSITNIGENREDTAKEGQDTSATKYKPHDSHQKPENASVTHTKSDSSASGGGNSGHGGHTNKYEHKSSSSQQPQAGYENAKYEKHRLSKANSQSGDSGGGGGGSTNRSGEGAVRNNDRGGSGNSAAAAGAVGGGGATVGDKSRSGRQAVIATAAAGGGGASSGGGGSVSGGSRRVVERTDSATKSPQGNK